MSICIQKFVRTKRIRKKQLTKKEPPSFNYGEYQSSSIDKTYLNTIYEGRKRFETKRLDKIAKKMKINIDDVIFFDDIKNNNEIRPLKNVVKVPAYFGSDFDNALGKIYKLFKDSLSLNLNEYDFKNFILNIDENYLKDDYKIKEIKIIKNKIEP